MDARQLKIGMRVKIKPNISITHNRLTANGAMRDMAGNGISYEVKQVNNNGIVEINEYVWDVRDICFGDEEFMHPIRLKGEKVTFDPCEL